MFLYGQKTVGLNRAPAVSQPRGDSRLDCEKGVPAARVGTETGPCKGRSQLVWSAFRQFYA